MKTDRKKPKKPAQGLELEGIVASPGICIGEAFVLEKTSLNLPRYWVNNKEIQTEIDRFQKALAKAKGRDGAHQDKLCKFDGRSRSTSSRPPA